MTDLWLRTRLGLRWFVRGVVRALDDGGMVLVGVGLCRRGFMSHGCRRRLTCVRALPFPSVTKLERADALQWAINTIPPNVRVLVAPFPRGHLRLAWAAHAGGEYFVQLLTGLPLLALLIAERRRFGVTADVRDLVDWKRRDLLGLFGVPARSLYARLLARVPPSVKTVPGRITIVQGEGSIARLTSRGPEEGRVNRRFKTYRYSGHPRAGPGTYRAASELNHWRDQNDPVKIYRKVPCFGVRGDYR